MDSLSTTIIDSNMSTMAQLKYITQSIEKSMTFTSQYEDFAREFECIESLVKDTPLQQAFDSFIVELTLAKGCLGDCQEEFSLFMQSIS